VLGAGADSHTAPHVHRASVSDRTSTGSPGANTTIPPALHTCADGVACSSHISRKQLSLGKSASCRTKSKHATHAILRETTIGAPVSLSTAAKYTTNTSHLLSLLTAVRVG
jgi:hypothetical protein